MGRRITVNTALMVAGLLSVASAFAQEGSPQYFRKMEKLRRETRQLNEEVRGSRVGYRAKDVVSDFAREVARQTNCLERLGPGGSRMDFDRGRDGDHDRDRGRDRDRDDRDRERDRERERCRVDVRDLFRYFRPVRENLRADREFPRVARQFRETREALLDLAQESGFKGVDARERFPDFDLGSE